MVPFLGSVTKRTGPNGENYPKRTGPNVPQLSTAAATSGHRPPPPPPEKPPPPPKPDEYEDEKFDEYADENAELIEFVKLDEKLLFVIKYI